MEKLIDQEHGPTVLIACLVIILALHLVVHVGKFVFEIFKKRSELTEETMKNLVGSIDNLRNALAANIGATHTLEERMRSSENHMAEVANLKTDIRKLTAAIKSLAGEKWADLRKSLADDDFL